MKLDVVIGIIKHHGLYLICQRLPRRAFPHTWEFPGGKVESADRTLQDALIRELREELGIEWTDRPSAGRPWHKKVVKKSSKKVTS